MKERKGPAFQWCVQIVVPHDSTTSVTIGLFEQLFPNTSYAGSWEDGQVIDILPPDSIARKSCFAWCSKLAAVLKPAGYLARLHKGVTDAASRPTGAVTK